jgi:transcriptional regulator with XRE-family HTH domain
MPAMPLSGREVSALVGRRLKILRAKRQWRQQDLVRASGISLSVIGALEQGNYRNVCGNTLAKLAAGLEVPIADLFKEPRQRRSLT